MKKIVGLSLLFLIFYITGCATTPTKTWTSSPDAQVYENPCYQARLEPIKNDGPFFEMFRLSITNKTNNNMEIDWNKTRYVHNDRIRGGFIFKGIKPEDIKNLTIPSDIITAGQTFSKEIAPIKLLARAPIRAGAVGPNESGFSPGIIPEGENGISLVVKCGEQEIIEKISLTIQSKETQ